jgi:hypothetical protein
LVYVKKFHLQAGGRQAPHQGRGLAIISPLYVVYFLCNSEGITNSEGIIFFVTARALFSL